jgi:hypothetical protein
LYDRKSRAIRDDLTFIGLVLSGTSFFCFETLLD